MPPDRLVKDGGGSRMEAQEMPSQDITEIIAPSQIAARRECSTRIGQEDGNQEEGEGARDPRCAAAIWDQPRSKTSSVQMRREHVIFAKQRSRAHRLNSSYEPRFGAQDSLHLSRILAPAPAPLSPCGPSGEHGVCFYWALYFLRRGHPSCGPNACSVTTHLSVGDRRIVLMHELPGCDALRSTRWGRIPLTIQIVQ